MANHSSILTWRIPWTKEPGGLQVHRVTKSHKGSQRVTKGHKTEVTLHTCMSSTYIHIYYVYNI